MKIYCAKHFSHTSHLSLDCDRIGLDWADNTQITLPFYTRVKPDFPRFSCGFGPGLAARLGPGLSCTAAQGLGQARQPKLATRVNPILPRLDFLN